MGIFERFARIYTEGNYGDFSRRMGELLPAALKQFDSQPRVVLDLACGEGSFAVAMAQKGLEVTGLDLSPHMLGLARERAQKAGVNVEFVLGDMRSLTYEERFDLVTCWFDSLNYLTEPEDLKATFAGVSRALQAEGLFIFDMNTIYGLAVIWPASPCYVQQDSEHVFEVHVPEFDFETGIATMTIIAFSGQGNSWERIDEEHKERGYRQHDIVSYLKHAGFQVLACWGSLREMSEAKPDSGRIWYVAKKNK